MPLLSAKDFLAAMARERADPGYALRERWDAMMQDPMFAQRVAELERAGIALPEDPNAVDDLYDGMVSKAIDEHPVGWPRRSRFR